jgi:hypothetical protein
MVHMSDTPPEAIEAIEAAADAWARKHGCRDIGFCNSQPLKAFTAGWAAALLVIDARRNTQHVDARQEAAATENEACAQLAEDEAVRYDNDGNWRRVAERIADLIRARNDQPD